MKHTGIIFFIGISILLAGCHLLDEPEPETTTGVESTAETNGSDPREYQHGVDFVPLPDETYALIWASSGNPPTGQLPNDNNWTHDIYYSRIDPSLPDIDPVLLISNPEAQEPVSSAISSDGHIMITMEDGWHTDRQVAQRYGVYDAELEPVLPYPQMVADGGHSGHVAAAGNRFVVFYSEGWIDKGGVNGLGSGDNVWGVVYDSRGRLEYTVNVAAGDESRDWWPLVAGSDVRALLLWQRFVDNEPYAQLMFSVLDIDTAALVVDGAMLEGEIQYYTYGVVYVPSISRFLITGTDANGTGFAYLVDEDGNVVTGNTDLPAPVRESQAVIGVGANNTLAVEPVTPSGIMVLSLSPRSIELRNELDDSYVWSSAGTDGIFLSTDIVYIVGASPDGLVERTFTLP